MNNQRNFDTLQIERLGKYIYALRDPRDKKIFYVGQGTGNRVFDHFNEADAVGLPFLGAVFCKGTSECVGVVDVLLNCGEVRA